MKSKQRLHFMFKLAGAVATAAVLTACGGGNGGTPSPAPSPSPAPAPSPSPSPSPSPAPSPAPAPATGAASECFNEAMLAAGTTFKLDYAVSGGLTGTSNTDGSIGTATTFNGNAGVMPITQTVVTNYSAPVALSNTINMTAYQSVDGFDILSYGGTLSTTIAGVGTVNTTNIIDPAARDKRYTLSAGGTYTLSQTLKTTITIPGLPAQEQTVSTSTLITYVGQESVTVPAGTYTACKFTDATSGSTSTTWIIKGKGVMAKSVTPSDSGEVTLQLQGTSRLNGAAI
jgi:hypothetical protein